MLDVLRQLIFEIVLGLLLVVSVAFVGYWLYGFSKRTEF